ncbi:hypothetical protein SOV_38140 [Sporomusa ovata DSM 2662]|uniref:Uncharacterized protein n=1 Tax=Sporomusa ovata TaxID=2378 RepID=A0A0U1KS77_9FIRM|nr:hypothetical protein [Sporomusa ovata]EQB26203.1 hypothetical protein SOV_3c00770 [Sporomusa ovata DSM 2662]CQR70278.1 hypothetical protein SpAn4DRAFT_1247 [Sporomusa ovata]
MKKTIAGVVLVLMIFLASTCFAMPSYSVVKLDDITYEIVTDKANAGLTIIQATEHPDSWNLSFIPRGINGRFADYNYFVDNGTLYLRNVAGVKLPESAEYIGPVSSLEDALEQAAAHWMHNCFRMVPLP